MVTIIRDTEQHYVHQSQLLVGDVMLVANGMEIPADGLLL
jgi:magnesium-transporting ATPase (P-type)